MFGHCNTLWMYTAGLFVSMRGKKDLRRMMYDSIAMVQFIQLYTSAIFIPNPGRTLLIPNICPACPLFLKLIFRKIYSFTHAALKERKQSNFSATIVCKYTRQQPLRSVCKSICKSIIKYCLKLNLYYVHLTIPCSSVRY